MVDINVRTETRSGLKWKRMELKQYMVQSVGRRTARGNGEARKEEQVLSSHLGLGFGMNVIQESLGVQKAFLGAVLRVVMMNPSSLPFNSVLRDHMYVESLSMAFFRCHSGDVPENR